MKMKHFAFAAGLLAALSLASCSSSESDLTGGVNVETQQLTFSIAIPKGDPVTYATHDQAEYAIESLWMYEFDAAGTLQTAPVNIKTSLTGTGPEYTYTKSVTTADKGIRRFIFVANEQVSGITAGTSTLTDLQAKLAGKTLAANASSKTLLNTFSTNLRIPMTGEAVAAGSNLIPLTGTNKAIKVEMTRILARIDVTNNVPNLVISDIKLANANSKSYLFLNGDYEKPSTNAKVSGITTFATMPSSFAQGTTLNKAFYLYEGAQPAAQEDALHVQVTGKLNGADVFYNIPFYKDGAAVTVKRNHIYKLVLGTTSATPAPGAKVTFTIQDTPWNEITFNETFTALAISYGGLLNRITIDPTLYNITLDRNAYVTGQLTVIGDSPLQTFTSLTVTPQETYSWLTVELIPSSLKRKNITVTVNNTGVARTAVLECYTDANPNEKRYVTITQNP